MRPVRSCWLPNLDRSSEPKGGVVIAAAQRGQEAFHLLLTATFVVRDHPSGSTRSRFVGDPSERLRARRLVSND
jgi:hypothetical protein